MKTRVAACKNLQEPIYQSAIAKHNMQETNSTINDLDPFLDEYSKDGTANLEHDDNFSFEAKESICNMKLDNNYL